MANLKPDHNMEHVDELEKQIIDAMGPAAALDAITRALDYDTKAEIYAYIMRSYDIEPDDDEPGRA